MNSGGAETVFATYPSLRGRVAFVSGGASGLGAEFVAQLARQGARVGFVDVDVDRGRCLEHELAGEGGGDVLFLECDVRDVSTLQHAIRTVANRFGPIRVLVNNAANDRRHRVEDVDVELWDDSMA